MWILLLRSNIDSNTVTRLDASDTENQGVIVHEHPVKTKTPGTCSQIRNRAAAQLVKLENNKDQTDVSAGGDIGAVAAGEGNIGAVAAGEGDIGAVAAGEKAAPLAHCRESLSSFF